LALIAGTYPTTPAQQQKTDLVNLRINQDVIGDYQDP